MRDIKFRAWNGREIITPTAIINGMAAINSPCDINDKVMTDNDGVKYYCNWDMDKTTDYPLMQYTGVKDKNGVEIYEGDIVESKNNKHYWRYTVGSIDNFGGMLWALMYENNLSVTEVDGYELYTYERQQVGCGSIRDFVTERMTVIGNIYENPDLLEFSK